MSEMVERVARALAERRIREVRKWDTKPDRPVEMLCAAVDYAWPEYVDEARTAIEAMMEPTGQMLVAARDAWDAIGKRDLAAVAYTAMIAAALQTTEPR